ncbi:MAG: DsbA family oxidoreductase [Candidatus Puniceispirillaceae bacterium]
MTTLTIDIYSDIICPWCYIGKKRLEEALSQRPSISASIRWRAFLLNPSMPRSGMDRQLYLKQKFGEASNAVYDRIANAGKDAGIDFQFQDITLTPETSAIHALLIASGKHSFSLSERFFQAYFLEGRDISDPDVQKDLIHQEGCENSYTKDALQQATTQINDDIKFGADVGIDGVPFFVFNEQFSLAGAHPAPVILSAIDAAVAG